MILLIFTKKKNKYIEETSQYVHPSWKFSKFSHQVLRINFFQKITEGLKTNFFLSLSFIQGSFFLVIRSFFSLILVIYYRKSYTKKKIITE